MSCSWPERIAEPRQNDNRRNGIADPGRSDRGRGSAQRPWVSAVSSKVIYTRYRVPACRRSHRRGGQPDAYLTARDTGVAGARARARAPGGVAWTPADVRGRVFTCGCERHAHTFNPTPRARTTPPYRRSVGRRRVRKRVFRYSLEIRGLKRAHGRTACAARLPRHPVLPCSTHHRWLLADRAQGRRVVGGCVTSLDFFACLQKFFGPLVSRKGIRYTRTSIWGMGVVSRGRRDHQGSSGRSSKNVVYE